MKEGDKIMYIKQFTIKGFKPLDTVSHIKELTIWIVLLINLSSIAFAGAPTVSINLHPIEKTDKGFFIQGEVTGGNLNPEGQIVEYDGVSIIADIQTETNTVYPLLPQGMYVRAPAGAETPITKGSGPGGTMTKTERDGIGITSIHIAKFDLRKYPVWRAYGGLGVWNKKAPSTVTKKFKGYIPLKYTGKTIRIRALLEHNWGGPYASWPAYSFANQIGFTGKLKGVIKQTGKCPLKQIAPKEYAKMKNKLICITSWQGDEIAIDMNGDGKFIDIEGCDPKNGPIVIGENTIVMTGLDSQATVTFGERGKVTVNKMTNFSIIYYIITDDGITAKTNMNVGDIDVEVDKKFKEIDFSVSTPTCITGVRGTIFHISHHKNSDITIISVDRGKVEVTPKLFSATPKMVIAGQSITVNHHSFGKITSPSTTQTNNTTLYASSDAYVYAYNYRNWNRSNRGKYHQLSAGWHPIGGESRTYIKFNLTSVTPAKTNHSILKLYHFQTTGNNGIKLGIYRVTSSWNEGTDTYHSGRIEKTAPSNDISWAQQPSIAPTPIATFNPGAKMLDWTEVDITPLVKQWLSGTPNYGLVIKSIGDFEKNTNVSTYLFASRERDPNLDEPKGKSKAPALILSKNTNVNIKHIKNISK